MLSPLAISVLERLLDADSRAAYELFRVECVETATSARMQQTMGVSARVAASRLYALVLEQMEHDIAMESCDGAFVRCRLDTILCLAVSAASAGTREVRELFYLACDLNVAHGAGIGEHGPRTRRHLLVRELSRIRGLMRSESAPRTH